MITDMGCVSSNFAETLRVGTPSPSSSSGGDTPLPLISECKLGRSEAKENVRDTFYDEHRKKNMGYNRTR